MIETFMILIELENTSSRNEKEKILRDNISNEALIKILEYTYNPYKVYGIGKKAFTKEAEPVDIGFFELLDWLLQHNTGSDEAKAKVNGFLMKQPLGQRPWFKKVILKDLKIGITGTTINKIWPDLIPSFEVMLAHPFNRLFKKVAIEYKIDGCRCVAIKQGDSVNLFTRNGKKIEGFEEIENDLRCLPVENCVFDGEIVGRNYKDTMNKLFAKAGKKVGTYMIFDILTVDEFQNGSSKLTYLQRKKKLEDVQTKSKLVSSSQFRRLEFMFPIAALEEPGVEQLTAIMAVAVERGFEGIMIKDADGIYECKRSQLWQKMKPFESDEFEITGYEEGEGKLEGMLGKVLVDVNGVTVGVGSGWTEEERKEIWNNQEKYLGRLVEVQYQGFTEDGSLRFPTVKGFRFDKE